MSLIWIGRQVTGPLVDRPAPNDPSLEARVGNEAVFTDSDTGKQYITNGQVWIDVQAAGALPPGVTSDLATPGGLVVDGGLVLQGSDGNVPDPAYPIQLTSADYLRASDGSWNFGEMTIGSGNTPLIPGEAFNVDGLLSVQPGGLVVHIYALVVTNGDVDCQTGTLIGKSVELNDPQGLGIWQHDGLGANTFTTNKAGGIGCFGRTAQTAPRTLAQATITAITDANAKTAVQACANALADIGALTLT